MIVLRLKKKPVIQDLFPVPRFNSDNLNFVLCSVFCGLKKLLWMKINGITIRWTDISSLATHPQPVSGLRHPLKQTSCPSTHHL